MEQILRLRNKDKVARSVKIVPPDSKLFQVHPCKKVAQMKASVRGKTGGKALDDDIDNMSCRVAPGMEISYIIRFSPEAKSDYSYDLNVLTERERFVVPIRAVGCRAMLDFPDTLDFGQVPVKHVTEKPVMIRNIGEKTTKWKLTAPAGFELNKKEGILQIGETEQIIFKFVPQESRVYQDECTLSYDGLEASVAITGEAHNDNVFLSKSHLHMDPTSITLYSHQYYTIVNKSSVPIEFSWRALSTEKEEVEKKTRLNEQLVAEEMEE
jgi:hydrocephalus-inducing protein